MIDAGIIAQIFDITTQHAAAMAGKLTDTGLNLLTGLAVIQLCWITFRKLLEGAGVNEIIGETIILALVIGILSWMITDLGWLTQQILAGFDWIAAKLTGTGDAKNMLEVIFASMGKASSIIWDGLVFSEDKSWWQVIKDSVAGMGSIAIKLVVLAIFMLLTVVSAGIFLWSQIQVLLAIAILPVFLPFYIVPPLSKFADGVLDFFVKSAAMKMIAVLLMSIGIRLLEGANEVVASVSNDRMALDLIHMTVLLFVGVVLLILMLQIPTMTNAMFSGQTIGLSRLMPGGMSMPRGGGSKPLPLPRPPSPRGGGKGIPTPNP